MMPIWFISRLLLVLVASADGIYHNEFAVHIPGGPGVAQQIASKHGFVNRGQIGALENHFLFVSNRLSKRSTDACSDHAALLEQEPDIHWFQQQTELRRTKRNANYDNIPDPLYRDQWFLNHGAKDGSDMNVKKAWEQGYTGKGVVVTILDDGIQHNHPDLKLNYDPLASKDINDNDDDPMPQDNGDNKHGTRCAGEVAAEAFNDVCGVGVAFNASIGGVRMLDGLVNDAVEARSLSLNPSHIDVYSASWGPEDDGKTVDGPGPLAKQAFVNGIKNGRGGKGSIFVWASGNGGHHTDNCNCDGYTNSVFTLSISSATQGGLKPWYLEECSSTLATTYSSGTPGQDASITTVDQNARLTKSKLCTNAHTGTSASAPLAAGVVALALEANTALNWRDLQHLVVLTANPQPLSHEPGWSKNAVGRSFSHKFGYGLLDAGRMVELALAWKTTPPQHICETRIEAPNKVLSKSSSMNLTVSMITDGCDNMLSKVRFLEHIQCRISLKYFPRGALKISLRSPRGTITHLLLPRPRDRLASGFEDWPFLSVHFWGEDPTGEWTLELRNAGGKPANSDGILKHWQLVLYGTETDPYSDVIGLNNHQKNKQGNSTAAKTDPSTAVNKKTGTEYAGKKPLCHSASEENCVQPCPSSHYLSLSRFQPARASLSPKTCRNCHPSCKECYGPTSRQCLSCPPLAFYIKDRSECVTVCPDGYSTNKSNSECEGCGDQCFTCHLMDDTVQCTACKTGLVLLDGKCTARCPENYFIEQGVCKPCHSSCKTCTGALDTQCGRCAMGTYYFERRCVRYCPPGYFSQERFDECMACPHGCDSCTGLDGACTRCRENWIPSSTGECLPPESRECQPGMYTGAGTCLACHQSCKTCIGPKDRDCSSCYPDHRLYISSCTETCPPRSRPAVAVNSCLACPHACAACNAESCTKCLPGYTLLEGACMTSCPAGYFTDQDLVCGSCHMSCQDCYGPGSNQCISCNTNKGLMFADGECLESCPTKFYQTKPCPSCAATCESCSDSCDSCKGPGAANCTSCSTDKVLEDGVCKSCEDGFFLQTMKPKLQTSVEFQVSEYQCTACHSSCATCSGPDQNQCTSCSGSLQYDSWAGTCVPCCNARQDTIPCCLCGSAGMCTSPSRLTRSLGSSTSLKGIIILVLCLAGVLGATLTVSHCRPQLLFRRSRRMCRGDVSYSKVVSRDSADKSPFLREASDSSEDEMESDFHVVNS